MGDWKGEKVLVMKRGLFNIVVLFSVFCIASCSTPEEKAKALVKKHMESCLYHPETYECADIRLDSAFSPFADPAFLEKITKLKDLSDQVEECESAINSEKSQISRERSLMSIYGGSYATYMGRSEYSRHKEELEEHQQKLKEELEKKESTELEWQNLYEDVKKEAREEPRFIGYIVTHRYRAHNNAGQTVFGDGLYLVDSDISKILWYGDTDDEEFASELELIQQVKDEIVRGE